MPSASYPGIIKTFEMGDNNKNKTPYVRFHLGYTGWPDEVDSEARAGIELQKRQQRKDFYVSEDALWRLDEFVRTCGVEPHGRAYGEIFPELIGKEVLIEVLQDLNQSTNEMFNKIEKVVGTEGAGKGL